MSHELQIGFRVFLNKETTTYYKRRVFIYSPGSLIEWVFLPEEKEIVENMS